MDWETFLGVVFCLFIVGLYGKGITKMNDEMYTLIDVNVPWVFRAYSKNISC